MEDIILYWGLAILGFIIVIWAQININSNYKKFKEIKVKKGLSGQEVARKILDANGLENIHIVETQGELTDHYDPKRKVSDCHIQFFTKIQFLQLVLRLMSVAMLFKIKKDYTFMKVRSALVPFVNLVSYLGYFGLVISIFAGLTGYLKISILVLVATIIFQLVTLPVEFVHPKEQKNN